MKKTSLVLAVVLCICGSALAADWNFYGSARVSSFYSKLDKDPFASRAAALGLASGPDTSNYEQNLNGNARIGARVTAGDHLKAQFEYGALQGKANVRILWGEWDFGAGSLGIGKNYTPLLFPYSNQVYNINGLNKGDTDMSYFGMLYGDRKAQVRLTFGNFQMAAVAPAALVYVTPTLVGPSYVPASAQPDTQARLPSIQAKYKINFSQGHIALAAGYQNFEVVSGGQEHEVTSYILGLGGQLNAGATYFKANIWGGQNVGNLANHLVNAKLWSTTGNAGTAELDGDGFGLARWDGSKITDRDAMAYLLVAGYTIRKGLYLEAGCGYTTAELESSGASRDDAFTYYLQSTIFLAPGVFITPEIGGCDFKQDGQTVITYAGVKWQINF